MRVLILTFVSMLAAVGCAHLPEQANSEFVWIPMTAINSRGVLNISDLLDGPHFSEPISKAQENELRQHFELESTRRITNRTLAIFRKNVRGAIISGSGTSKAVYITDGCELVHVAERKVIEIPDFLNLLVDFNDKAVPERICRSGKPLSTW